MKITQTEEFKIREKDFCFVCFVYGCRTGGVQESRIQNFLRNDDVSVYGSGDFVTWFMGLLKWKLKGSVWAHYGLIRPDKVLDPITVKKKKKKEREFHWSS